MTHFVNPQAAPEQARNTVTAQLGLSGLHTAIPEGMHVLAETTVGQSREAHNRSKDAFEASVAAAVNRKIIDIAQQNADSVFDLAKSLAGVKNLAEIVELQEAYWQKQFSALIAQVEEVRALKVHVKCSTDERRKVR